MNYKIVLANYLVLIPIIVYIVLFLSNPTIQKILQTKCVRNVITDIDLWFFEHNIYRFLSIIQNPLFDLLSAIPYLFHFMLPFTYLFYMFKSKQNSETILRFIFSFGVTNLIGVLIQYFVPTPPPWMLLMEKKLPEANFHRVDLLIGIGLFKNLYAQSKLVCGAFPSLHCAWPSVVLFGGPFWIGRWFCITHVCLISFAALYSMHHYLIDVIFGILLALFSCKIAKYINFKSELIKEENMHCLFI